MISHNLYDMHLYVYDRAYVDIYSIYYIYIYKCIYIYTWNPNDPCFDWKRPSFGGFNPENKGQTGSRYIYIYVCVNTSK